MSVQYFEEQRREMVAAIRTIADHVAVRSRFIRQVENCPAGRLVVLDKATQKTVEPELPVSIGLVEDSVKQCNGPL
jgi:hypothetical protein